MKPYTLAKKMLSIWDRELEYEKPKDLKTVVKYIRDFEQEFEKK